MIRNLKRHLSLAATTGVISLSLLVGCQKNASHADEKDAVTNALKSNNMGDLSVSQDRDKGVMTLTGDVQTADQKAQAENIVKQAAPDYVVANQIGVRPAGAEGQAKSVASNLDSAIEDNYKAALKGHENLNDQSISGDAKNGTLVIKGTVKTSAQKREAFKLAKAVPNVQQVVDEIEVKPSKHSTAK